MGYQINKYNWCVINKIIDNKQRGILWHVNDLKTSPVDRVIVSRVLVEIDVKYGKILKMIIAWGKVHKFLGMTINYSFPGKVIFSMVNYIENILDDIPKEMKG